MKVALVYDRVNKWGGAERVLLSLHEIFPDAPLYTSVHNPANAKWANVFDIRTSFLQKIPKASSNHELLALFMPSAFESFSFDDFDLVISVTSEAAKGIITKPHTKHICYCLTPTRYLWSGYDSYFTNKTVKNLSGPAINYLRGWDSRAAHRPDKIIAISKEVQQRVKKYYHRDSEVVYPAVVLGADAINMSSRPDPSADGGVEGSVQQSTFGERDSSTSLRFARNDKSKYFLIVSRLSKFTQYKRVDLAIQACNALKLPLKIVGTGSWEKELKRMAGPTIEFVGSVDDRQLAEFYKKSKALLFPGYEDFGLAIVESQAFGRPVIAFRKGGAVETVKEGKTGIFFNEQTKDSLINVMKKFSQMTFDEAACKKQAEQFNFSNFKKNFLSLVNELV